MSVYIDEVWPDTAKDRLLAFEQLGAVLGGLRVPLDDVSRKNLSILLHFEGGCDAVMTSAGFEVMSAQWLLPQEFYCYTAPGIVSELLRMANIEAPVAEVRAIIGPGVIGAGRGFGRKVFWLEATPQRVVMQLRTASGADERDLVERPEPYPGFLVPARCPYCGEVLRTPRAKQCRFCKRNWHDPENLKWLDGRAE